MGCKSPVAHKIRVEKGLGQAVWVVRVVPQTRRLAQARPRAVPEGLRGSIAARALPAVC